MRGRDLMPFIVADEVERSIMYTFPFIGNTFIRNMDVL